MSSSRQRGLRRWSRAAQCSWCALPAELLEEIHREHVLRGLGSRVLTGLARKRLGGDVPSARSLSRHLTRHVHRVAYEIEEHDDPVGDEAGASGPAGQEFAAMWALHRRLERRIRQLDEAMSVTSAAHEVDLNRLAQLAGLANADRGVVLAIDKIRQSPASLVGAIQHALILAMASYNRVVVNELVGLGELAKQCGDPAVGARFRAAVAPDSGLRKAGPECARQALDETLRALKIDRLGSIPKTTV